jgi:outer membrane protein assembly factor BamB
MWRSVWPWLLLLAVAVLPSPLTAQDFSHWRGPTRNGHVQLDSGFKGQKWPLDKPRWRAGVGEGSTSPVVIEGRLYVLGWKSGRDTLHALDAATGESLWTQSYDAPRYARHATGDEGLYSGPTATPEYDAAHRLLFTLGSDGELRAWRVDRQGELAWRKNLYDDYKMPERPRQLRSGKRDYGYTSAPLLTDAGLLVEVGGQRGTIVAFDPKNGKELWASQHQGLAGHTGGITPLSIDGVPCAAVLTLTELVVIRLDEGRRGETAATFPWETAWANNLLTPTVCGDSLLISAWHTHHAIARVRVSLKDGAQQVWKADYASHVGSPLVQGDRIYFAGTKLVCLDAATGQPLWEGGAFKDGASLLLTRDERLIALGSNGRLALVESATRSPDAYRELARVESLFQTDAWPHAAAAAGRLYLKDRAGNLLAFDLPGP